MLESMGILSYKVETTHCGYISVGMHSYISYLANHEGHADELMEIIQA